jgi:hypothetical protein
MEEFCVQAGIAYEICGKENERRQANGVNSSLDRLAPPFA